MSGIGEIYKSRMPALQRAKTKLEILLKNIAAGIEAKTVPPSVAG
jgi:hypothetical protein